jgi:hypothetical protein
MISKIILKYKIFELAIDIFMEKILSNFKTSSTLLTTDKVSPGDRFAYIKTVARNLIYTDCRIVDIIQEQEFEGVNYRAILISGSLNGKSRYYTILEEIGATPYVYYYN